MDLSPFVAEHKSMKTIWILLWVILFHPPLAPASADYMKGADLYAWEAPTGLVRYSLLPGTNRSKTQQEIEFAGKELK